MRDVIELGAAPLEDFTVADIASIVVEDRLRLVDRALVEAIAASMAETGQHQPIAVSVTEAANVLTLVDGEHRLEAAKLLGWTQIKVIVRRQSQAERRKHEIHANLIRAELTILDRNVFIGKLAEIHEAENLESRHGGDRKSRKWREKNQFANLANWSTFSKEAARRTGLSTRSIDRARELADKLCPDAVALIRGSKIADNQSQLQALAALEHADQVKVAREIAEGRATSFSAARITAGMVPEGGVVREEDRPLAKIEPILLRLSRQQLLDLRAMVDARLKATEPPAKPAKTKKGSDA